MNTQVTRPGHMLPEWKQGELQAYGGHVWYEDTPSEAAREARAGLWLQRVQWFAFGCCAGFMALWASITL